MQLLFNVKNQLIERTDYNHVVADSENYLTAKFIFLTTDWSSDDIKTAIFRHPSLEEPICQILTNDICEVPHEVIKEPGFSVSVFAGKLITTDICDILVKESGYGNGGAPKPPTPTVYEQIISMIENIHPEIDPDELAAAVDAYMEEHPIDAITEEQMEEYVNTFFEEHKSELVGPKGDNGLSAYQIAVDNGYVGTEVQWLESLKGANGGTFIPSVSEDGILSWTNNLGLPNPDPVNIKGRDLVNQGVEISPIDNTVSIIMQPNVRYFVDGAISSLIITAPENYNPWDEFYIKFTTSTSGCVVTPPAGWQYVEGCTSSFDANNVYEWDVLDGAIACPVGTAVA